VRQLTWALAFLVFDREAGRVRPGPVAGLAAAVLLTLASHLWLSGAWMRQAGFATVGHAPAAIPALSPPTSTTCRTEASR
jgi:hypothetical protein